MGIISGGWVFIQVRNDARPNVVVGASVAFIKQSLSVILWVSSSI